LKGKHRERVREGKQQKGKGTVKKVSCLTTLRSEKATGKRRDTVMFWRWERASVEVNRQ